MGNPLKLLQRLPPGVKTAKGVGIYEAMGAKRMEPLPDGSDPLWGHSGLPAFRIESRIPERGAQRNASDQSNQMRLPGFAQGGSIPGMNWFTGSLFRGAGQDASTPNQALVDWAKTQPGYENWDGTPIAPTLAEDRALITQLNSYAPDLTTPAFDWQGIPGSVSTEAKQLRVDQRDDLLDLINANPTMSGDQLSPGLYGIKAEYKPRMDAMNDRINTLHDNWWKRKNESHGLWKVLDRAIPLMAGAAVSAGVGGIAGGGVLGNLAGTAASESGVFGNKVGMARGGLAQMKGRRYG